MSAESLYKTSTDYKHLYDLIIAGDQIICFVDFRFRDEPADQPPSRDICIAKAFETEISASARGIGYLHVFRDYPQCEEVFIKYCQQINLTWVVAEVLLNSELKQSAVDGQSAIDELNGEIERLKHCCKCGQFIDIESITCPGCVKATPKDEVIENLSVLIEQAANMMRGMTMDPAIPRHAKSAMISKIQELEKAIKQKG